MLQAHTVEALLTNTLIHVSRQFYLDHLDKIPFLKTPMDTISVFTHSYKWPAPVMDIFSASVECQLREHQLLFEQAT